MAAMPLYTGQITADRTLIVINDLVNKINAANAAIAGGFIASAGSFTVAALPAGVESQFAYASNGRKIGEGPGAGTGLWVYFSLSQWRVVNTDAPVTA
jgi:hypothetical protein